MKRFAELLDLLSYEAGRNNKLRLMTDYFRTMPDPDRGYALAALTGALSFQYAKPSVLRALIEERTDPVLFGLSRDYVGDTSETIALMWPADPYHRPNAALTLSDVVATISTLGKAQLPAQLARWLDALDETGRWALLKLVTGALRIGVSARLAKTAAAALGDKDPQEIELIWPGLKPPYTELFAWLEGRGDKPANRDVTPFRPPMLSHALETATHAFYARSDLDLILSSPVAARKVFAVRMAAVALTTVLVAILLASPFINLLAARGGARWLGTYALVVAFGFAAVASAFALTIALLRSIGPRRRAWGSSSIDAAVSTSTPA